MDKLSSKFNFVFRGQITFYDIEKNNNSILFNLEKINQFRDKKITLKDLENFILQEKI